MFPDIVYGGNRQDCKTLPLVEVHIQVVGINVLNYSETTSTIAECG